MNILISYIIHVVVTVPIVIIHILLIPFNWVYEKTDWMLITDYNQWKDLYKENEE